ncbi:guanylate-binding protein 1 [Astyanax mexicanus]|uniref:Guanylate-binding protein 1-like n=1 Tax=Astyanax mexicanus TaxID=7994 RepID=W5L2X2_ASTMX|nr:guanylate-binding protein 1 [Astyanax mexicanus]
MLMEGPVCLISTDSEGQLSVQKEAKDILDGITSPVVVVSVVGLYRTGKSYLMNRLAGKQRGFALGSTIESKTKGIWMWCVPHPHKKEHTLVLLDTEGLGDIDKGDEKHDTWIFCLAVLLSSTLVYNSLGVIDNMALERLHYVTELTENIRVKARKGSDEDESAEFMRIFPSFIWSVRDFTLELKKDNRDITADEYLETALELKTGSSVKINNYNLPRSCLRNFFAERRCFVFRRPAADEDLRRMEELTEEELEPEFLKQTQEFCNYVFSNTKPKTLTGGRTLSGTVLGSLAEVYVEAIRSGRVPCLENAVEALAQIQNGRAVEQAMQAYLTEVLDSACFPLDPVQLSDIHTQAERKAVEVFISISFNDAQQTAQLDLMRKIQSEYECFCGQNKNQCEIQCGEELREVFAPLEEGLRDGTFMLPGGYRKYRDTVLRLTAEYRKRTHTLFMCEEVLNEYLTEKDERGKNILAADQYLSQADQKMEEECLKREAVEQKQRALEEQNRQQEQVFRDQQRTYEQHVTQLLERLERERERAREDTQRVVHAKLNEQKALLEVGFKKESDLLQKEIDNLKKEMNNEDKSKRSTLSQVVDTVGQAATLFLPGIACKAAGFLTSLFSRWL